MAQPNRTSKRLRIAVIVMYIIQVFLLTENYIVGVINDGKELVQWSDFELIYHSIDTGKFGAAAAAIVMALVPIVGFFVFSFDKTRNIKNIYGFFSSLLAVFLILFTIGDNILLGSTISLILYLPIVFLSVMGMFSRNIVASTESNK